MKLYWVNSAGKMMCADIPGECHPTGVDVGALCQCSGDCRVVLIDFEDWQYQCSAGLLRELPKRFAVADERGDRVHVHTQHTVDMFMGAPADVPLHVGAEAFRARIRG